MVKHLRVMFWIESIAGGFAAALGLLTVFWRDWIEAVFGVDPDHHNGSLEWIVVIALFAIAAACGMLARVHRQRIRLHHLGIEPTSG
jgi:hypothetical protein